jgi:hypothetical protein
MRNYLVVCCALLFSVTVLSQGKIDGFYRGTGNTTAVLGLGFEDTKHYFAGTEKTDISRNLYYANLYGAYGVSKNFDISLSVPYLVSNQNRDFQDLLVFAKYRFFERAFDTRNFQASLAIGFSTPLSDYSTGGLNDIGQQATVVESRLVLHYHLNTGWFATLITGFSYKFKETPNSFPATLKLGKTLEKWYYDFYYSYQYSFGGIDYRGTPSPQNFKEIGVNFHKVGGTVYRPLSKNLGGYISLSYVLGGRNVFQGPSYGLGLVYSLNKH